MSTSMTTLVPPYPGAAIIGASAPPIISAMPKPDPLPLDVDDLSDLPVSISDWRRDLERQSERLEKEGHTADGYFLVIAAFQLLLVCRQYADHDPDGAITEACDDFDSKHPHLRSLRNMLLHADEYYRGQGNIRESQGHRTFTIFLRKFGEDWHIAQGFRPEGQCNLSQLARDGAKLAERALAACGPGASWSEQTAAGRSYDASARDEPTN